MKRCIRQRIPTRINEGWVYRAEAYIIVRVEDVVMDPTRDRRRWNVSKHMNTDGLDAERKWLQVHWRRQKNQLRHRSLHIKWKLYKTAVYSPQCLARLGSSYRFLPKHFCYTAHLKHEKSKLSECKRHHKHIKSSREQKPDLQQPKTA